MSKAEKFIQNYTNNCSNEMWSPYPQINNDVRKIDGEPAKDFSPWLTPDQARKAVKIARKEILNDICEWIDENIGEYCDGENIIFSAVHMENIDIFGQERFINDLKQAMKDE